MGDGMEPQGVRIEETMGWPGVPGRKRFNRAMEDLRTGAESPDAAILESILETPEYQRWADNALMDRMDRNTGFISIIHGQTIGEEFRIVMDGNVSITEYAPEEIATRGSDAEFIGLAMMFGEAPEGPHDIRTNNGLRFTRLHRDPQWMGFNGWLPLIRGTRLEIHGSVGVPHIAKALKGDLPKTRTGTAEIPPGEALELARITAWHGVEEITWHEC